MVDKNAAKKARMEEQKEKGLTPGRNQDKTTDAIRKARRNQQKMPPENFKQQLGYDPFHCETISSESDENLAEDDVSELDQESMWQRNKGYRDNMTKSRIKMGDDSSLNESHDFKAKNKFTRQRTRSPTKRKNKKKKDKDDGLSKNARVGD